MKTMMLVLSVLVSTLVFGQEKEARTFDDLMGAWRNKQGAGLDIVDSNTVYIVRGDQRKLAKARFSNIGQSPITFNLTLKDSTRLVTLKGLLMLVGDNTLQWQVFDSETKPVSYNGNRGNFIFLKRIDKLLN